MCVLVVIPKLLYQKLTLYHYYLSGQGWAPRDPRESAGWLLECGERAGRGCGRDRGEQRARAEAGSAQAEGWACGGAPLALGYM